MLSIRVIPTLLMRKGGGLVKTVRFDKPTYVGDPVVAVKIFNDKEVDELILLDIGASTENRGPDFEKIKEIASEAFMPLAYGGGIRSFKEAEALFLLGVEKVIINSAAEEVPGLIEQIAKVFGTQAVVGCVDVDKTLFGKSDVFIRSGQKALKRSPIDRARELESAGAGEIMVTSIEREGSMKGYDTALIRSVADAVSVPVIAHGGAGRLEDFTLAVKDGHASAVAAGSLFVFHGKHRAVLITYPKRSELEGLFGDR